MQTRYQAKQGFVKRTVAGESLLVPIGATTKDFNGMIMLNESGAFLWELLQEASTREELVAKMRAEFDAEESVICSDVDEFIANGVSHGLISEM